MKKKCVSFTVIPAVLFFVSVCTANAATYYVDNTGDDSITLALLIAKKGDIIKINDGIYNEGQLNIPEGVSLTSTSQNVSKVTIQPKNNLGLNPFINLSSPNPGSNGNQTISYLSFVGDTGTYHARIGIKVVNRSNVKITHCNIIGFTGGNGARGVHVRSTEIAHSDNWWEYWPSDPQAPGIETNIDALWPANPVENFELSYCTITNCGYAVALDSSSRYPAVQPYNLKNSIIHHNTINTEDSWGQPIKSVCAFLDNVDIYNNDITMAYYKGMAGQDDPMSSYAIETWLHRRGCEIYNNKSNGMFSITYGKETKIQGNEIIASLREVKDGPGIEFICQCEGEVCNNYIENTGSYGIIAGLEQHCGSSDRIVRNVKIHNNIIYNAKREAISVRNWNTRSGHYVVEDIGIYNNICDDMVWTQTYRGLLYIISINDSSGTVTTRNVTIKNNICVNSPGYAGKTLGKVTNLVIDENLFWNNYKNSWSGSTPTNTIIEDPGFEAKGDHSREYYKLKPDSPMWNAFNGGVAIEPPSNVRIKKN